MFFNENCVSIFHDFLYFILIDNTNIVILFNYLSIASSGVQCIIPWRGDDMEWRHLKVTGDLGVVAPVPFHPDDDSTIHRALEGSDIVINLIGKVSNYN